MKLNELMIGDWVHNSYTNENYRIWPQFFSQIHHQDKEQKNDLEDFNIFPVPLTKEILLKNYFEIQDQGGGWYDVWTGYGEDNEDDIEVEFRDDGRIYVTIDAPGKGYYFTTKNIQYVHQLQHILRECGFERELENM